MTKESVVSINKNCIFRETFNSFEAIKNNGGTQTDVSLENGVASFVNGSNINYGDNSKFDLVNKLSITVKLKIATKPSSGKAYAIIKKRRSASDSWQLNISDAGYILFSVDTGSNYTIIGSVDICDGKWHTITGSWNGSAINLYVDGDSAATEVVAPGKLGYTSDNVVVNKDGTMASVFESFVGQIEFIDVYAEGLTSSEAKLIYQNSLYKGLVTDGLVYSADFVKNRSSFDSISGTFGTDTNITYKKQGARLDNTSTSDIGNLNLTIKTIIAVIKPNTDTETILDLDGTNKLQISSGTLSCGGFSNTYVNGVSGSTVVADQNQFIAVTDSAGVSVTDFDIGDLGYDGILKSILFFSTELTAEQITQNYQYYKQRDYLWVLFLI